MNKLSKIFKSKGIGFILLAFAAGIVLLLLPENDDTPKAQSPPSVEYVSALEDSLEGILKDICGAECKAMITLETGYSYTYASNEKLETECQNEVAISKTVSKEYVIVSDDSGESLVVIKENLPKVKGVAIVCKKGSAEYRETVVSVVCSLFDISEENVGCVIG